MAWRRWLPILATSAVLLHGMSACMGTSDENLNPQPLPPREPDRSTNPPPNGESAGAGDDSTATPGPFEAADAGSDGGGDL